MAAVSSERFMCSPIDRRIRESVPGWGASGGDAGAVAGAGGSGR